MTRREHVAPFWLAFLGTPDQAVLHRVVVDDAGGFCPGHIEVDLPGGLCALWQRRSANALWCQSLVERPIILAVVGGGSRRPARRASRRRSRCVAVAG